MNLLLSVAKFIFGYLINSRAILMDAWNGFSDMVSSVLSILSAAYASKRVDREHPLGFGRLEYVTSMFSTVFIVFMGLRGIYGAITDIITPDDPRSTTRSSFC
jgi:cation diffusion facilitator family transporter